MSNNVIECQLLSDIQEYTVNGNVHLYSTQLLRSFRENQWPPLNICYLHTWYLLYPAHHILSVYIFVYKM